MSGDWHALSCTTAGHPFYRFQSHCGTYVVRRQIGRLHLRVWLPPRGSDSGVQWFGSGASSYSGVRGDAVGRPRDRVGICLPVTDDDFTDSGLGRRDSGISGRIFGYLEPPQPALDGSPTLPLVENALPTRDQFLPYKTPYIQIWCSCGYIGAPH